MKATLLFLFAILLNCHADKKKCLSKDKSNNCNIWHRDINRNEFFKGLQDPDTPKYIARARYIVHNLDWAAMGTISTLAAVRGYPFASIESMADGTLINSTGIPYFYMTKNDFSSKDLQKNNRATVLVSLDQTNYCKQKKYDAVDPRCARVMLSGLVKKVKENASEYKFAKAALFERHPAMNHFPNSHGWFVTKLKIEQILLFHGFGGATDIPVRDYLAFNYTDKEMLEYNKKVQSIIHTNNISNN